MPCEPSPELKEAYASIATHTLARCGRPCLNPGTTRCCRPDYCEDNARIIKSSYGIELQRTAHPRLPFMTDSGCSLEPWQRPRCAIHHCRMSLGGDPRDPEWTAQYFQLADRLDEIEADEADL